MSDTTTETPAQRLRITFELIDTAERMVRARLRRESPGISDEALEQAVAAWYTQRTGAEFGDADGIPAKWPRR